MNDLLFYTLLIALLYYFFYYLPQQKKPLSPSQPKPFTHQKETQTEEEDNPLPGPVIKFPSAQSKPVHPEDPELEKTLDQLITSLRDFNQQLK